MSSLTVCAPGTVFTGAVLLLLTMISKLSEAEALLGSVAVTFTVMVPTSLFPGVPENVCVAASKWSQPGSAAPVESVAP